MRIPQNAISEDCKDLILSLLTRKPLERLGARRGALEIKEHPWFAKVDWKEVYDKKLYMDKYPIKTLSGKIVDKHELEDLMMTDEKLEMRGYKFKYKDQQMLKVPDWEYINN